MRFVRIVAVLGALYALGWAMFGCGSSASSRGETACALTEAACEVCEQARERWCNDEGGAAKPSRLDLRAPCDTSRDAGAGGHDALPPVQLEPPPGHPSRGYGRGQSPWLSARAGAP